MKKPIILGLIFLCLGIIAYGTITYNFPSPGEYITTNSTTVTFNWTPVVSSGTLPTVLRNCTLYTHVNNRSGEYIANISSLLVPNNTMVNRSVVYTEADRVWWKVGCWDAIGNGSVTNEAFTTPAVGSAADFTKDTNLLASVSCLANISNYANASDIVKLGTNRSLVPLTVGNSSAGFYVVLSAKSNTTYGVFNVTIGLGNFSINSTDKYVYLANTNAYNNTWMNITYGYNNFSAPLKANTDYNLSTGLFVGMKYPNQPAWCNYTYPGAIGYNAENSTERIFDVDTYFYDYLTIEVPLKWTATTEQVCDSTSEGAIYYNVTVHKHYGCNSTAWNALW